MTKKESSVALGQLPRCGSSNHAQPHRYSFGRNEGMGSRESDGYNRG